MSSLERILVGLGALFFVLVIGTLGYVFIEGWHFFDALYMTVITLTTVGFQEVHLLSRPGRAFTIVIVFMGLGFMFYVLGAVAQVVVEGQIREVLGRRKLEKLIQKVKDHYIICGFGRIGEIIARQLTEKGVPLVVVEHRPQLAQTLEKLNYLYVLGNAAHENVLLEAGLERAKGLVTAVSSDADNVYIVLTARSLNPKLFIMARSGEEGSEQKLLRAGADKVISPYVIGGRRMAQTILRPTVLDFLDVAVHGGMDLSMEEIPVGQHSHLVGLALKDSGIRQKLDLIIVAIKRADGQMVFNPQPATQIMSGDTLIALGAKANLDNLIKLLAD